MNDSILNRASIIHNHQGVEEEKQQGQRGEEWNVRMSRDLSAMTTFRKERGRFRCTGQECTSSIGSTKPNRHRR